LTRYVFAPPTPSDRRLIKPFGQIVQIERHEIDDALPRNPQSLSLFFFERRAGIFRHDYALQDSH
jgi:hypothetical protein